VKKKAEKGEKKKEGQAKKKAKRQIKAKTVKPKKEVAPKSKAKKKQIRKAKKIAKKQAKKAAKQVAKRAKKQSAAQAKAAPKKAAVVPKPPSEAAILKKLEGGKLEAQKQAGEFKLQLLKQEKGAKKVAMDEAKEMNDKRQISKTKEQKVKMKAKTLKTKAECKEVGGKESRLRSKNELLQAKWNSASKKPTQRRIEVKQKKVRGKESRAKARLKERCKARMDALQRLLNAKKRLAAMRKREIIAAKRQRKEKKENRKKMRQQEEKKEAEEQKIEERIRRKEFGAGEEKGVMTGERKASLDQMYEVGIKKSAKDCKGKKKPRGVTEAQMKSELITKSLKNNMARWGHDLTNIKTSIPGNPVESLMIGMNHKSQQLLNPADPLSDLGDSKGSPPSKKGKNHHKTNKLTEHDGTSTIQKAEEKWKRGLNDASSALDSARTVDSMN